MGNSSSVLVDKCNNDNNTNARRWWGYLRRGTETVVHHEEVTEWWRVREGRGKRFGKADLQFSVGGGSLCKKHKKRKKEKKRKVTILYSTHLQIFRFKSSFSRTSELFTRRELFFPSFLPKAYFKRTCLEQPHTCMLCVWIAVCVCVCRFGLQYVVQSKSPAPPRSIHKHFTRTSCFAIALFVLFCLFFFPVPFYEVHLNKYITTLPFFFFFFFFKFGL